ncbi:MAG: penicillin-binding protein 2 [Alistipes sp.]|nr:penicillin-binding protein 2 [Candidatus Minthomonas equi]
MMLVAGTVLAFLLLVGRLSYLQLINTELKLSADNNAFRYETLYPPRGQIFDRNGRLIVSNKNAFDIMVTPADVKEFDTLELCRMLDLDTSFVYSEFRRFRKYRRRIGFQTIPFARHLSAERYSLFMESQQKFQGFTGTPRTERIYEYNAGGNLLGYVTEVDEKYIKRHPEYRPGDYVGRTGIEEACERELRGKKGCKIFLRDAMNVIKAPYRNGECDTAAVPGINVITTIDAELQNYVENLMKNKVGSVVAIEPSTGEILTMVSSPGIDVSVLGDIGKHYRQLNADPFKPLFNRAVASTQPPGSVFKLVNGLIALEEEVVTPETKFPCSNGYHVGDLTVGCHSHPSPIDLRQSVMMSCNAYYCALFRRILDNPKYPSVDSSFTAWRDYVGSFGFGSKLGSDFPAEKASRVPTAEYYDKMYSGRWNSVSCISLSIGQGEMGCTPLHLANLASIIANRGYYYIPHIIRNHPDPEEDARFAEKHFCAVDSRHFEPIIDGMWKAVNAEPGAGGTARSAHVNGLDICGKTGTAENPHGDTHAVFICFAPKEHPVIAVAVYLENAGFGGTWAAPVASLAVEKYINGDIDRTPAREVLENRILNADLLYKNPASDKFVKSKNAK